MIILFFSAICGVFALNFFALNMDIQGINRAVIYTPIELLYSYVESEGSEVFLDKNHVMQMLDSYYERSVGKYTNNFTIDYYFYNQEDESLCLGNKCTGMEVTVKATLTMDYQFKRTMFYEIRGNING